VDNGSILNSVLGALYTPLSAEPQLIQTLWVNYDGEYCFVQIKDDTFRTSIAGGTGHDLVANLRGQSLADFVAWLDAQPGYQANVTPVFAQFLVDSGLTMDRFGAWALAETLLDVVNVIPYLGINQSVLMHILRPIVASLRDILTEIGQITTMSAATTATGIWLDSFGTLYGVPRHRLPGPVNETDDEYRARIVRDLIAPRANNYGIQAILRGRWGSLDITLDDDMAPQTPADAAAMLAGGPWNRLNPFHFFVTIHISPNGGFNQNLTGLGRTVTAIKPWGTSFTALLLAETDDTIPAPDDFGTRWDTFTTDDFFDLRTITEETSANVTKLSIETWPCTNPWLMTIRPIIVGEGRLLLVAPNLVVWPASVIDQQGWFWADFTLPWDSTDTLHRTNGRAAVFAIGTPDSTELLAAYLLWTGSTWNLVFQATSGTSANVTIPVGTWAANTRFVVYGQWTPTGIFLSLNGAAPVTLTTAVPGTSGLPSQGYLGSWFDQSVPLNANWNQVAMGQGALPDDGIASLYTQTEPLWVGQFTAEGTEAYRASFLWSGSGALFTAIPVNTESLFFDPAFVQGPGLLQATGGHYTAPSDLLSLAHGRFVAEIHPAFASTDALLDSSNPTIFALRTSDWNTMLRASLTRGAGGNAAAVLLRQTPAGSPVSVTVNLPPFTAGATTRIAGYWTETGLAITSGTQVPVTVSDGVFDATVNPPPLTFEIAGFAGITADNLPLDWGAWGEGTSFTAADLSQIAAFPAAPAAVDLSLLSDPSRWLLWSGVDVQYSIVDPLTAPLNDENSLNDGNQSRTTVHDLALDPAPLALLIGPTRCLDRYVNRIGDTYSDFATQLGEDDQYSGATEGATTLSVRSDDINVRPTDPKPDDFWIFTTTERAVTHAHLFTTNNIGSRTQSLLARLYAGQDFEPDGVTPLSLVHGMLDQYLDFINGVPMLP
jgi:hypothetical protein